MPDLELILRIPVENSLAAAAAALIHLFFVGGSDADEASHETCRLGIILYY